MKVKFLVDTAYQGPRKSGDVIDVPEDFAKRWVKNGIAALVKDNKKQASEDDDNDKVVNQASNDDVQAQTPAQQANDEDESKDDLSNKSAKELYSLCVEKGIEVEAKKSKEYYLEKLA